MRIWILVVMMLFSMLTSGAQAQDTRQLGLNTTLRHVEEEIKYVQPLGIRTLRVPLQWQLVKIRPGEYDWSTIDRIIKTAQERQIGILFNIRTIFWEESKKPSRQRGVTKVKSSLVDKEEWLRFAGALASRYQGRGIKYEIENEVNEGTSWKGTLEDYLDLLKGGYDVMKKADPKATVLPAAMNCGMTQALSLGGDRSAAWKWHDNWLQPILSTKKFDVVNVHNYYFPSGIEANGLTFRSYLEHIRELMKRAGCADLPLWITETGYVSSPKETGGRLDHSSFDKQAQWLKEAYQQAFEFGVERVYWLLLRDRREPYFGSMGLADAKGNPRPSWDALIQFK